MIDFCASILAQALPLVPFDGWSDYTFRSAVEKAGLTPAAARQAFPKGIADLVDYFFLQADESLKVQYPENSLRDKRVPDRIETLIMARLEYFSLHKEALRRALAWCALPWHLGLAAKSLCRTLDTIWRLAGDTSTDFNFYSKRALLGGVYSSTVLFWLNDGSGDKEKTREFLKRRLADIATLGRVKKKTAKAI